MDGSVKVADLPKLWNERMQAYLGCTPKDDAQGVLQDVHWCASFLVALRPHDMPLFV